MTHLLVRDVKAGVPTRFLVVRVDAASGIGSVLAESSDQDDANAIVAALEMP